MERLNVVKLTALLMQGAICKIEFMDFRYKIKLLLSTYECKRTYINGVLLNN